MIEDAAVLADLRGHHLFRALSPAQFERIQRAAVRRRARAGQHLFEQGQPCAEFYFLRRGRIKLCLFSPRGAEKVVDIVGPGQTFAEAIMFMDRSTYPVSAEALEDSELVVVPSGVFREILQGSVETCFQLMGDMSRRLRGYLNEIDALTLRDATLRFVHYLAGRLGDTDGGVVELDAPKNVIASRISVQPESLSRILRSLQQQGFIEVDGNRVRVPDVPRLRQAFALPGPVPLPSCPLGPPGGG